MPGTQFINNGVTTGGFGAMTLDMSPAVNQFVKGQEIEQERRRKVIENNENQLYSLDLGKLSPEDLAGGIGQKYEEYKKLGMDTNYKDFNKHDAQMRATHQMLQNQIQAAINARKTNASMYDDMKDLVTPDARIKMLNDQKGTVVNPDGTYRILNPSDYQIKPKDFVDVHSGIIGILKDNTEKPQVLNSTLRSDGKYNKLSATRINVENTIATSLDKYNHDTKWKESVDHAVAQENAQNPNGTPLTPADYIQNIVEREISAKQSDRSKQLYPQGIYTKGKPDAYVDVADYTPPNYVSHVTIKTPVDKVAQRQVALYHEANKAVTDALATGQGLDKASAALTAVVKGTTIGGNQVTGAEVIGRNGKDKMGIRVHYVDPETGKFFPQEYHGEAAKTIMGLLHNTKVKNPEAFVEPGLDHPMAFRDGTSPAPAQAPAKKSNPLNPMTWGKKQAATPTPTKPTTPVKRVPGIKASESTLNYFKQ